MPLNKLNTKLQFLGINILPKLKDVAKKVNEIITYLNLNPIVASSYTSYEALLYQDTTDAPIATIKKNNIGATPVWSRVSAGVYQATVTPGIFSDGKQLAFMTLNTGTKKGIYDIYASFEDNLIVITTWNDAGVLTDSIMQKASIEVRVYNS